jgi:hypothetical protein
VSSSACHMLLRQTEAISFTASLISLRVCHHLWTSNLY